MQRNEPEGVVLSCDFCGTDWDQVRPMIEGHHGSIICLECLKAALAGRASSPGVASQGGAGVPPAPAALGAGTFTCTMCIRDQLPATLPRWVSPKRSVAIICKECIEQAARAFDRDPDVAWKWER
jgi:hypothetical protein